MYFFVFFREKNMELLHSRLAQTQPLRSWTHAQAPKQVYQLVLPVQIGKDLFPYLKVPLDVRSLEQQNWNKGTIAETTQTFTKMRTLGLNNML